MIEESHWWARSVSLENQAKLARKVMANVAHRSASTRAGLADRWRVCRGLGGGASNTQSGPPQSSQLATPRTGAARSVEGDRGKEKGKKGMVDVARQWWKVERRLATEKRLWQPSQEPAYATGEIALR